MNKNLKYLRQKSSGIDYNNILNLSKPIICLIDIQSE